MMFAAAPALAAPAESADQKALLAIEANWAKAMVAADVKALTGIMASDWRGQGDSGVITRAAWLDRVKTGKNKFSSMTNKNLHAFASGNVGYVMGQDDEKSTSDGKDTSGTYSWIDVYEKRDGKWVAVASQNTKMK
jgi:ketosteroid isomerase-like protein